MNIAQTLNDYELIAQACEDAIKADRDLIDPEDRWLPRPWTWDFTRLDVSVGGEYICGAASVYTSQTGGSHEHMGFRIPMTTIEKYLEEA